MDKFVSRLDAAQRHALLEWADLGSAAFLSGLVVAVLKSLVDLVV